MNEGYSKAFFAHLGEKLGVKDDRGYMCVSLLFSLNKPNLFYFYTYSVFDDPGRAYMGSVFPRIIILIDIWALMTDHAWLIATRARRSRPFSGSDPYDVFPSPSKM